MFPGGRADDALQRVMEERDELLISKPILDELLGVLARKFERDADALARVALFLSDAATLVRPGRRLVVLRDDADNRILECALAGRADAIVTGDRALLALGAHAGIPILSLRAYLEKGV